MQGAKLKTLNHADDLIAQYVDNDKIQKLLAFQTFIYWHRSQAWAITIFYYTDD